MKRLQLLICTAALLLPENTFAQLNVPQGIEFGTGATDPEIVPAGGGLEFDIPSGIVELYASDATRPFFKAGEGFSETVSGGWYRIAQSDPGGTWDGKRLNAQFILRDEISTGGGSCVVFRAGVSHNHYAYMSLNVLSHTGDEEATFTQARIGISEDDTHDRMFLDIYVEPQSISGEVSFTIQDNHGMTGAWNPVDWGTPTEPDDYDWSYYELDKLFAVSSNVPRFTVGRGGDTYVGGDLTVTGNAHITVPAKGGISMGSFGN